MFSILRRARVAGRFGTNVRHMQTNGGMPLTLAAANDVFYDNVHVWQVDVPSFNGAFGILPKHVPTLAILKSGILTVYQTDGAIKKLFVSSGTVTVNEDASVQILAEEAQWLSDLDPAACREILSKSLVEQSRAVGEVEQAEANIAVEVAEALVQATVD